MALACFFLTAKVFTAVMMCWGRRLGLLQTCLGDVLSGKVRRWEWYKRKELLQHISRGALCWWRLSGASEHSWQHHSTSEFSTDVTIPLVLLRFWLFTLFQSLPVFTLTGPVQSNLACSHWAMEGPCEF